LVEKFNSNTKGTPKPIHSGKVISGARGKKILSVSITTKSGPSKFD